MGKWSGADRAPEHYEKDPPITRNFTHWNTTLYGTWHWTCYQRQLIIWKIYYKEFEVSTF